MSFTIPSGIFQQYYDVVDELIDNSYTSKTCTIVFPPIIVDCNNCTTVYFGGISKNVYENGGPAPFNLGNCPICGGNGKKELASTDTINLRVYYKTKDWVKVANINIPNADAQVIGYLTDLPKLRRAQRVEITDPSGILVWRCSLSGEPYLHGFGNRYFVAFLKRI